MDRHFLEFWGHALLNAAQSQKQLEDLAKWLPRGFFNFQDYTTLFQKAYELDQVEQDSPDYLKIWKKAEKNFLDSFHEYLILLGAVPREEYAVLAGKGLSMMPLPRGNRVSFLAPSGAMLVVLTDLCTRLDLEVPELDPQNLKIIQDISPSFIRMRNPVDIWAAASTRGVEFGYREGMDAVLRDANIDAVVVVLLLTEESGIPSYDFIVKLAHEYPGKPIFVTYTGDKKYEDECKEFLEPMGVPTFPEIEQPFEVLAIMARCRQALNRPD